MNLVNLSHLLLVTEFMTFIGPRGVPRLWIAAGALFWPGGVILQPGDVRIAGRRDDRVAVGWGRGSRVTPVFGFNTAIPK